MQTKSNPSPAATKLRRRAETRLRERRRNRRSMAGKPRSATDTQRLLHELEVHQVELELQNAELQAARNEAEAALEKYTALYDFAPIGYFTLDHEGTICGLNLAGARLLGLERAKLVDRRFGLFIAAEAGPAFADFLRQAFASGTQEPCEISLRQKGKPPRWVCLEACGSKSGQECRLAVMDITRRKQAETDRARLEQQVYAASEREQRRIGESLREDLCQRLAGIGAAISAMANTLKAKARPESGQAIEIADEVRESLQQARHFANLLQPVPPLEQGLVAAMGGLAFGVEQRSGIRCHFQGEDLPDIAAADANHLYRIAQEALNNAVQHAQASRIAIGLSQRDRALILTVADDGSGLVKPLQQGPGLGLQIMRYRSAALGAALTIESKPGRGTVVTCRCPVVERDRQSVNR